MNDETKQLQALDKGFNQMTLSSAAPPTTSNRPRGLPPQRVLYGPGKVTDDTKYVEDLNEFAKQTEGVHTTHLLTQGDLTADPGAGDFAAWIERVINGTTTPIFRQNDADLVHARMWNQKEPTPFWVIDDELQRLGIPEGLAYTDKQLARYMAWLYECMTYIANQAKLYTYQGTPSAVLHYKCFCRTLPKSASSWKEWSQKLADWWEFHARDTVKWVPDSNPYVHLCPELYYKPNYQNWIDPMLANIRLLYPNKLIIGGCVATQGDSNKRLHVPTDEAVEYAKFIAERCDGIQFWLFVNQRDGSKMSEVEGEKAVEAYQAMMSFAVGYYEGE